MKTSALRHILCGVLTLLIWTNAFAQIRLGPRRLVDAPAPTLENPEHLGKGLRRPGYVGAVGGVAFDTIASPAKDLTFKSLSLDYDPNRLDGNRLWVFVDGKRFSSPIYDWQLIPIAKFADSPYYACVTLNGKLIDSEKQKRVEKSGGRIINYHPAFINTLLGLRLLGLDILIWEPYAIDLPKNRISYILGRGESKPNIRTNGIGRDRYLRYKEGIKAYLEHNYHSYVICDYGRDIRFDFQGGSLTITGEPFFHFWRYKFKSPGYNEVKVRNTILNEIKTQIQSERLRNPKPFNEKEWYINSLIEQMSQHDPEYVSLINEGFKYLANIKGDEARKAVLRELSVLTLHEGLVVLRVYLDPHTVVPLKEYSERLSAQTQLLRAINPAVWDASVNVMRYAAFFRYCEQNYPEQWRSFIDQVNRAPMPDPQIKTPPILK